MQRESCVCYEDLSVALIDFPPLTDAQPKLSSVSYLWEEIKSPSVSSRRGTEVAAQQPYCAIGEIKYGTQGKVRWNGNPEHPVAGILYSLSPDPIRSLLDDGRGKSPRLMQNSRRRSKFGRWAMLPIYLILLKAIR